MLDKEYQRGREKTSGKNYLEGVIIEGVIIGIAKSPTFNPKAARTIETIKIARKTTISPIIAAII